MSYTFVPWRLPLDGRDPNEEHRASTPLELLFDLSFVVAGPSVLLIGLVTTGAIVDHQTRGLRVSD